MKVKVYVVELPTWVRRVVVPVAIVGAAVLGWGIARASVPNTFKDGDVLTAQALNDNFKAVESPPGTILAWGGDPARIPQGWLLCDGAPLDRNNYAPLFNAIGTSWGAPSGSQFNVPDLRGRFLRGMSAMPSMDDCSSRAAASMGGATGCAVGSVQTDDLKSHIHSVPWAQNTGGNSAGVTSVGSGLNTVNSGPSPLGNETRPKNALVVFIIKS